MLVRYSFPAEKAVRFAGRSAVCVADGGCRHRARRRFTGRTAGSARPLQAIGIHAAYTRLGIVIALTFIGLPFIVRTVQPVLEDLDKEFEEAAASLGAGRWQTFTKVLLPTIMPAALTGFALAFARGIGEYGSVIFIAGNMPMRTEITPLLIVTELEQFDYADATAIAVAMLVVSFVMLLAINACRSGAATGARARNRVIPTAEAIAWGEACRDRQAILARRPVRRRNPSASGGC